MSNAEERIQPISPTHTGNSVSAVSAVTDSQFSYTNVPFSLRDRIHQLKDQLAEAKYEIKKAEIKKLPEEVITGCKLAYENVAMNLEKARNARDAYLQGPRAPSRPTSPPRRPPSSLGSAYVDYPMPASQAGAEAGTAKTLDVELKEAGGNIEDTRTLSATVPPVFPQYMGTTTP
ncbi:hypothetical protein MPER_09044 [Moniliophthora perniciosa FA553]|nr:hypothetical protein MPER_09044 [Moniliophthora perniciosa FA553]